MNDPRKSNPLNMNGSIYVRGCRFGRGLHLFGNRGSRIVAMMNRGPLRMMRRHLRVGRLGIGIEIFQPQEEKKNGSTH